MTTFGRELRTWREARGLSQLALSTAASVSQRHISFLETGRSRPSREMVLHLGRSLELSLRQQNEFLASAGLIPEYEERRLTDMPAIARVLEAMLAAHEPNMAVVIDRHWDLVMVNAPAGVLMSLLFPELPDGLGPPANLMRLSFHPEGLRRHVVDWEASASALLRRLRREVAASPNDSGLRALLVEIEGYPGVSALGGTLRAPTAEDLVLPTTYRIGEIEVSLMTMLSVIGDPHDVTLEELRLETFWPVDDASREAWESIVGSRPIATDAMGR